MNPIDPSQDIRFDRFGPPPPRYPDPWKGYWFGFPCNQEDIMSVQPQRIGLSPEDRDALQALTDDVVRILLDRDWDAFLELLTDDVVFLPPDEPAVIGKAAAADFLNAFPIITQYSATIESADGSADHAVVRSSWEGTLETEEGETRMVGKRLATYRKEGGRWRVATNCWNRDAPVGG